MAGKKIKLNEEAIGEILVADTDSKSGSEASDFDYFEEEEAILTILRRRKKRTNTTATTANNNKPQQK